SLAGFIWAALGSPRAAIRWQAAHCVRRLAECERQQEIDALLDWMVSDGIKSFGSRAFPFYRLHARQWLLIALARIALDHPKIIRRHSALLMQLALNESTHLLIEKYAAGAALAIESAFPGTYETSIVESLLKVGVSQLPIRELEYGATVDTPWHASNVVDRKLKLHFAFDFDRYWFGPLGDVFAIPTEQDEELARDV